MTMTATNNNFDMVLGPNQTTFSFNNEELVVSDDQAHRSANPFPYFFRVASKKNADPSSHSRKPPKAFHATAVLTFSPSKSPKSNREDIHLALQTVIGYAEAAVASNTFPPFIEYFFRLTSPLDVDTLTFLGAFQDMSKKTYHSLNRQLSVTCNSVFEGASIFLCHQSKPFINIL